MKSTIRKPRTIKDTRARYIKSTTRRVNIAGRQFVLRDATPDAIKLLKRDYTLYDKYAKHLEAEHKGEYAAIGLDGSVIFGPKHVDVLIQAAEKFGAGNFSLLKIGYDYALKWRKL